MTVRTTFSATAASLLLAGVVIGVPASAAMAASPCEGYSQPTCSASPTPSESTGEGTLPTQIATTDSGVSDTTDTTGTAPAAVSDESGELPFTGGEIAVATVIGLSALAAGGSFLIAGRRRPGSSDGLV